MALDVGVFQNLQPPKPIDVLGPYRTLAELRTNQLQQADIAGQIQQRNAEAQQKQIANQKALGVAQIVHDHVMSGGSLDDDALGAKIAAYDPQAGMNWQISQQSLKKSSADTREAQAKARTAEQAADLGPVMDVTPGTTLFNRLKGKPDFTAPPTPLQTAQAAEANATAAKNNMDAEVLRSQMGSYPQTQDEFQKRLAPIFGNNPNDSGYRSYLGQVQALSQYSPKVAQDLLTKAAQEQQNIREATSKATFENTNPQILAGKTSVAAAEGAARANASNPVPNLQYITEYTNSGKPYIDASRVNPSSLNRLQDDAGKAGTKVVDKDTAAAIREADIVRNMQKSMLDMLNGKLADNPVSRLFVAPENKAKQIGQIDPQLASMDSFIGPAISSLRAMAGSKGMRITQAEINAALDGMPKATDTAATAKTKLATIAKFLDDKENVVLRGTSAGPSPANSFIKPGGALDQLLNK